MNINQENAKLADEFGIPRLRRNQQQKGYNEIHFRRCVRLVWAIMIINVLLIFALLYFFFSQAPERYFATSFAGEVTPLVPYSLVTANAITQQNKSQENAS
ncbi:MAG: hypothetical protein K0S08_596 [Gammaproteobacteria bacterium]|jgi:hypothetical protein|nr:hypothetical protein [Gammaproteobacteria bacterium]